MATKNNDNELNLFEDEPEATPTEETVVEEATAEEAVAEETPDEAAESEVKEKKGFDPLRSDHGPLKHLVDDNFLQYASYVICDPRDSRRSKTVLSRSNAASCMP